MGDFFKPCPSRAKAGFKKSPSGWFWFFDGFWATIYAKVSCSLSYNLFALMHQLLPLEFANKRAKYIRYRLYAIAAKVIKTGRKVIIKCQAQYYQLLTKVLNDIKAF
ncbi:hypothetical protein BSPWISOXPB_9405 [uncultured Gammaproteobacteria bacterium]|nr:hypothetical protein BSPWISOXPB_9405 [uncultured Gammaproteobacteria bacterium]